MASQQPDVASYSLEHTLLQLSEERPQLVELNNALEFLDELDKDVHFSLAAHYKDEQGRPLFFHYFPLTESQAQPGKMPTINENEVRYLCAIAATDGFVLRKLKQEFGDVGCQRRIEGYELGQLTGDSYRAHLRFLVPQLRGEQALPLLRDALFDRHNRDNLVRLGELGGRMVVDLTDGVTYR